MAWPAELMFLFSRNRHGFGGHGLGPATPAADGPVAVAVHGASVQVPSLCLWDPHPKVRSLLFEQCVGYDTEFSDQAGKFGVLGPRDCGQKRR